MEGEKMNIDKIQHVIESFVELNGKEGDSVPDALQELLDWRPNERKQPEGYVIALEE